MDLPQLLTSAQLEQLSRVREALRSQERKDRSNLEHQHAQLSLRAEQLTEEEVK